MSAVEGRKILILNGGLDRETGGMTGDFCCLYSLFQGFLLSLQACTDMFCPLAALDFVQAVANGLNRSADFLHHPTHRNCWCTDMAN